MKRFLPLTLLLILWLPLLVQCTTASQYKSRIRQISNQLWLTAFYRTANAVDDFFQRLVERLSDFFAGYQSLARNTAGGIQPADFVSQLMIERRGTADRNLQLFGGLITDPQRITTSQIANN